MTRILQSLRTLRLYSAPLLLVVIACTQIARAYLYHQSPWKGGGFGMFSTNQSPGCFHLRFYLLTDKGESQFQLPSGLSKKSTHIRTVPTLANLVSLERQLAHYTWVKSGYRHRLAKTPPATSVVDQASVSVDPSQQPDIDAPALDAPQGNADAKATDGAPSALSAQQKQHYRPLTAGEPTPDAGEVPHVKGVRGEIWQEVFDPECGRASFVKFLAYTYLLDNESQDSG